MHIPGRTIASTTQGARVSSAERPELLMLGIDYAGHATRFANLRATIGADDRFETSFRVVSGWREDGLLERSPLPRAVAGRARATITAGQFASTRADVVWSSAGQLLLPYLWRQAGPLRRPLALDLDWTLAQQEEWAPVYYNRPSKRGAALRLARLRERLLWRATDLFLPWSNWAAASLARQGVPESRIHVLPPGVDLKAWQPRDRAARTAGQPLKVLFVGGDFHRKGGDMLIEVVRSRFQGMVEAHVVTTAAVESGGGIFVHRATPNSPELRALYASADLFVMPSRAECFGIATVEALASGLPAIVGDVGGAPDIVEEGLHGWRIEPAPAALAAALQRALDQRESLPAMGIRARRHAEIRFDARKNDEQLMQLLLQLAERRRNTVASSNERG
ncbi:MAG: glycosyltransferase family 4 protein [Dehalococcoidia bacterium]|nr:glycosyltransferase family 4 protein [Dehalococcoidia bacterium]